MGIVNTLDLCKICRFFTAAAFILCFSLTADAQRSFRGILINNIDSSRIPYAAVNIKETGQSLLTDSSGEFYVNLTRQQKSITISISAIGCKTTVVFHAPFRVEERIYLDIAANMLDEFAVKGLSAKEVVKIAIASIPLNYVDSSYFDYSFYRRYQKVNNVYTNLAEASPVVMFRLLKNGKKLESNEAFAVTQLRRSTFHPNIMNEREDNPVDLLIENPVYHLGGSVIDPARFTGYTYNFDTTNRTNDYVIHFICRNYSTDKHGIADYDLLDLKGEAWDSGTLVIERGSFAIKKIVRSSNRYFDYKYKFFPPQNNLVHYDGKIYFFEFTGGDLEVEYIVKNGKWRLKNIFRQYRHEFYIPVFDTKEFDISDNFEWYSDSVSKYTTKEYVDKFYPKMATAIFSYDTAYWKNIDFPFHYIEKSVLYNSLIRDGAISKQFYNESQIDEYAHKPKLK